MVSEFQRLGPRLRFGELLKMINDRSFKATRGPLSSGPGLIPDSPVGALDCQPGSRWFETHSSQGFFQLPTDQLSLPSFRGR